MMMRMSISTNKMTLRRGTLRVRISRSLLAKRSKAKRRQALSHVRRFPERLCAHTSRCGTKKGMRGAFEDVSMTRLRLFSWGKGLRAFEG